MQPDLAEFQMRVGCDERALAGLEQLPPGDQLVAMDIVESLGQRHKEAFAQV